MFADDVLAILCNIVKLSNVFVHHIVTDDPFHQLFVVVVNVPAPSACMVNV